MVLDVFTPIVRLFVPVFSDFLTVNAWRRENAGAGSSQCS